MPASGLYVAAVTKRVRASVVPTGEQPHAVPLYGEAFEVAIGPPRCLPVGMWNLSPMHIAYAGTLEVWCRFGKVGLLIAPGPHQDAAPFVPGLFRFTPNRPAIRSYATSIPY